MKLPNFLNQFYLRARTVPVIGPRIIGPFLSFMWDRVISPLGDFFGGARSGNPSPAVTTYAAAIATLRMQVDNLEADNRRLTTELAKLRWDFELRSSLELAALEGLKVASEKRAQS